MSTPNAGMKRLHVEVDLMLDSVDDGFAFLRINLAAAPPSTDTAMLDFGAGVEKSNLIEAWRPDGSPGAYQGRAFLRWLIPGQWTKVVIDLTYSPPRFEVSFDGHSVLAEDSTMAAPKFAPKSAVLALGMLALQCAGKPSLHFDNVRYLVE